MAINFTTLFGQLGKGVYLANLAWEFVGGSGSYITTDIPTEWTDYVAAFDGTSPAVRSAVADSSSQLASARTALDSLTSWVASSAAAAIIETAHADHALPAKTIDFGLAELIKQMKAGTKFVNSNHLGISSAAGGANVGNGQVVASMLDGNGRRLEFAYAEELAGVFTNNSTLGSEQLTVRGQLAADGKRAYNWPAGSGSTQNYTAIDAASTANNLLTNGSFDTFVVNTPGSWTIVVGTAGTEILAEPTVVYKAGGKALAIAGAATLTCLAQTLALKAKTPYAVNLWCKTSGTPAAGVLQVELWDVAAAAVCLDEEGNAASFTINLVTLGTAYVAKSAVFRLAEPVPASVQLRIRLTTALSAGTTLYIDHVALAAAKQQYTGGPYVAFFSGSANWSLDDTLTITPANDYGGLLHTAFWRLFDMPALGLFLPSKDDGSENILDSVIA